jgi:hypothetical protein
MNTHCTTGGVGASVPSSNTPHAFSSERVWGVGGRAGRCRRTARGCKREGVGKGDGDRERATGAVAIEKNVEKVEK